jgi:pimeloyl-ACP methyl ester carboxylesterase
VEYEVPECLTYPRTHTPTNLGKDPFIMKRHATMNLVFLPATDPEDRTYGAIPEQLADYPDASIRQVRFPAVVWYNESVRQNAMAQIRAWGNGPIILVGFSKSGLGAWHIARTMTDHVLATIFFDAPVARAQLPPWGTQPFYADDQAWQADLPLRTVQAFSDAVPKKHRLILISGANFHGEMWSLSQALAHIGHQHVFMDRRNLKHHWSSGWIEEGLRKT